MVCYVGQLSDRFISQRRVFLVKPVPLPLAVKEKVATWVARRGIEQFYVSVTGYPKLMGRVRIKSSAVPSEPSNYGWLIQTMQGDISWKSHGKTVTNHLLKSHVLSVNRYPFKIGGSGK